MKTSAQNFKDPLPSCLQEAGFIFVMNNLLQSPQTGKAVVESPESSKLLPIESNIYEVFWPLY